MPPGPACRIGDPISHDMAIPCGATVPLPFGPDPQTTLIEGMPAAHMNHGAQCAGTAGPSIIHPPPPAPVPIVLGSPTVFIGNMPAARWTPSMDTAGCGVFLGLSALAATRTTIIGDGGGAVAPLPVKMVNLFGRQLMQIGSSIFVIPDPANPAYQGQVAEALQRLNLLSPTFRRGLAALDGTTHALMFTMYNGSAGPFNATTNPTTTNIADTMPNGQVRTIGGRAVTGNGTGSSSIIGWDPNINGNGIVAGQPGADQKGADMKAAHEIGHGISSATAQDDNTTNASGVFVNDERNNVGLPAQVYNNTSNPADPLNGTPLPDTTGRPYTENGVRNDYDNAGVNTPYDPTWNPGPPTQTGQRPSYSSTGSPF
jgi:hypothetical protein